MDLVCFLAYAGQGATGADDEYYRRGPRCVPGVGGEERQDRESRPRGLALLSAAPRLPLWAATPPTGPLLLHIFIS
jgi:hypothetical protein